MVLARTHPDYVHDPRLAEGYRYRCWRASAMTTRSGTHSPERSRPGGGGAPARPSAERTTAGVSKDPPLPTGVYGSLPRRPKSRPGPAGKNPITSRFAWVEPRRLMASFVQALLSGLSGVLNRAL
jgi:hypothetical protein